MDKTCFLYLSTWCKHEKGSLIVNFLTKHPIPETEGSPRNLGTTHCKNGG